MPVISGTSENTWTLETSQPFGIFPFLPLVLQLIPFPPSHRQWQWGGTGVAERDFTHPLLHPLGSSVTSSPSYLGLLKYQWSLYSENKPLSPFPGVWLQVPQRRINFPSHHNNFSCYSLSNTRMESSDCSRYILGLFPAYLAVCLIFGILLQLGSWYWGKWGFYLLFIAVNNFMNQFWKVVFIVYCYYPSCDGAYGCLSKFSHIVVNLN